MGPSGCGILASPHRHSVTCRRVLSCEYLSTPAPPLCHTVPRSHAPRIVRELGHLLALGGVFQEFVGWMHRAISRGWCDTTTRPLGKFQPPIDNHRSALRFVAVCRLLPPNPSGPKSDFALQPRGLKP